MMVPLGRWLEVGFLNKERTLCSDILGKSLFIEDWSEGGAKKGLDMKRIHRRLKNYAGTKF